MNRPRIIASIEARMTSTRLPGKVMKEVLGKPLLELMIERIKRINLVDEIVVATTVNKTEDCIVELADKLGVGYFRGSENDVLSRVLGAAKSAKADIIVEFSSDCVLLDPDISKNCIDTYLRGGYDYVANCLVRTYPTGMDTQVFSAKTLAEVDTLTQDPNDRENVSLYIYTHPERYRLKNVDAPENLIWPDLGLVLDTDKDLELIRKIYEALYPVNKNFNLLDVITFLRRNPDIRAINSQVVRKKSSSGYFADVTKGK